MNTINECAQKGVSKLPEQYPRLLDYRAEVLRKLFAEDTGFITLAPQPIGAAKPAYHRQQVISWPPASAGETKDALRQLQAPKEPLGSWHGTMVVFDKAGRKRSDGVTGARTLGADLDEVDPTALPEWARPDLAWETSPGSWAAQWRFTEAGEKLVTRQAPRVVAAAFGIDTAGMGVEHMLRLPGGINTKTKHQRDDGSYPEIVWCEDENRIYQGEPRDLDEFLDRIIAEYPDALDSLSASGVVGEVSMPLGDLDTYLAAEVEDVELSAETLSYLDCPSGDRSQDRSRFIEAAVEEAASLHQIWATMKDAPICDYTEKTDNIKGEQDLRVDLARVFGKSGARSKSIGEKLTTQLRNRVGLGEAAATAFEDAEPALEMLCAQLAKGSWARYSAAMYLLASNPDSWLAQNLPDDVDVLEVSRREHLVAVEARRATELRKAEAAKKKAETAKKRAIKLVQCPPLAPDAELLVPDVKGSVYLNNGHMVLSDGEVVLRTLYPGTIVATLTSARRTETALISDDPLVTVDNAEGHYEGIKLTANAREREYLGNGICGVRPTLIGRADADLLIQAAITLGDLRGVRHSLLQPETYGMSDAVDHAEYWLGNRVLTATETWTTPASLHGIHAGYFRPEAPSTEGLDLTLQNFAEIADRYGDGPAMTCIAVTLGGLIVPALGAVVVRGTQNVGKSTLARNCGPGLVTPTVRWVGAALAGGGGAETVFPLTRKTEEANAADSALSRATTLGELAQHPVNGDEAGADAPNGEAAVASLMKMVFNKARRTTSSPSGRQVSKQLPVGATVFLTTNFSGPGTDMVAVERGLQLVLDRPLPQPELAFIERHEVRYARSAAIAAWVQHLCARADQLGGTSKLRAWAVDEASQLSTHLPRTGASSRHEQMISAAAVGLRDFLTWAEAHGADPKMCRDLWNRAWHGFADTLQVQASLMIKPQDPVAALIDWVGQAISDRVGHLADWVGDERAREEVLHAELPGHELSATGFVDGRPQGVLLGYTDRSKPAAANADRVLIRAAVVDMLRERYASTSDAHAGLPAIMARCAELGYAKRPKSGGRIRCQVRAAGRPPADFVPIPMAVFLRTDDDGEGGTGGTQTMLPIDPDTPPLPEAPAPEPTPEPVPSMRPAETAPGTGFTGAPLPWAKSTPEPGPVADGPRIPTVVLTPAPVGLDGKPVEGLPTPADHGDLGVLIREMGARYERSHLVVAAEAAEALDLPRVSMSKRGRLTARQGTKLVEKHMGWLAEDFPGTTPRTRTSIKAGEGRVFLQLAELIDTPLYENPSAEALVPALASWQAVMGRENPGTPQQVLRDLAFTTGKRRKPGGLGEVLELGDLDSPEMRLETGAVFEGPIPEDAAELVAFDGNAAYLAKMADLMLPLGSPSPIDAEVPAPRGRAFYQVKPIEGFMIPGVFDRELILPDHAIDVLRKEHGLTVEVERGWLFPDAAKTLRPAARALMAARDQVIAAEPGTPDAAVLNTVKATYQRGVGGLASTQRAETDPGMYRPHWQTSIVVKGLLDACRKIEKCRGTLVYLRTDGGLLARHEGEPLEMGRFLGTAPGTWRVEGSADVTDDLRALPLADLHEKIKEA